MCIIKKNTKLKSVYMHFDQVLTHLMSRLVKRSDRYKNIQLFGEQNYNMCRFQKKIITCAL